VSPVLLPLCEVAPLTPATFCPDGSLLTVAHELFHRGGARRVHVTPPKDHEEGFDDDAEIKPEALVLDIPNIEGEFLVPSQGVAAVDLRPTRHARLHEHALGLEGVVARQVAH